VTRDTNEKNVANLMSLTTSLKNKGEGSKSCVTLSRMGSNPIPIKEIAVTKGVTQNKVCHGLFIFD